jgi:hypothetical protein
MASPLRLGAALEGRSHRGVAGIDAAATPDERLQAGVAYLRSLTVVVARWDLAAADKITEQAADSVRGFADAMAQVIQDQIQTLRDERNERDTR